MLNKKLIAASALFSSVIFATTVFGQGALTPLGAPAPTMKSLAQIEARTPISSAPFTITTPGSYYLTTNLTVSTGDAIDINANEVTLDLNGFTISSINPSASGNGVYVSGRTNITIFNGHIRGGVTSNGSGVYSGSGFASGINAVTNCFNLHVSDVTVSGCLTYGIVLGTGNSSSIEACSAQNVGTWALEADTITHSTAFGFGGFGILGNIVSECYANGRGTAISVNYSVNNCTGISIVGNGISSGYCVNNCYGSSSTFYAVVGIIVLNSMGSAGNSSYGLTGDTVMNCEGYSGSGTGVYAYYLACNSFGLSSLGTGIYAFIGNGCYGTSSSGTPEIVTHKYNMP